MTTENLLQRLGRLSTTSLVDSSPTLRILPARLRPLVPGRQLVGDDDGLVVGSHDELAAAVDGAEAIELREKGLQARLLDGASLFDVLNYDEHLAALRDGR